MTQTTGRTGLGTSTERAVLCADGTVYLRLMQSDTPEHIQMFTGGSDMGCSRCSGRHSVWERTTTVTVGPWVRTP